MWRCLLLCFPLVGCVAGVQRVVHELPAPPRVSTIIIPGARLTGVEAPGWRAFELAQRQVAVALSLVGRQLAVVGPAQVKVVHFDRAGWDGTTALPLLSRAQLAPDEAVLLRTSAELREAETTFEREDARGEDRASTRSRQARWLLTVEVLHPATATVLAEVHGQLDEDPFAPPNEQEEFDPHWAMTRLLETLTREALAIIDRWQLPRAPLPELNLALAPAITAAQPDAARAQPDALRAEVWMQNRARFLTPWLDEAQAARLARTPPSLVVLAAPGGARLQPGDLILSVDGQPALPEVLARGRLKGQVRLRVGRAGEERDEVLP